MNDDPLDGLLQKLGTGDDAAAELVFRTYEPYLRWWCGGCCPLSSGRNSIRWMWSNPSGRMCCTASASRAGASRAPDSCGPFSSR